MPTFELEESDYKPIPEDEILGAELLSVKVVEKTWKDDDGNPIRKVQFRFQIQEDGSTWDGTTIIGETGTTFNTHPGCKLRNWAEALANTQFPAGYRLDTDILLGMRCRIIVGQKPQKDALIWNFVKDVMPARLPAGASAF